MKNSKTYEILEKANKKFKKEYPHYNTLLRKAPSRKFGKNIESKISDNLFQVIIKDNFAMVISDNFVIVCLNI